MKSVPSRMTPGALPKIFNPADSRDKAFNRRLGLLQQKTTDDRASVTKKYKFISGR